MILLTLSAQAQQANHEKVLQQLDEVTSINYVMNYSDYIYIIKQTQLCII